MDTCRISSATLAYRIFGSPDPDPDSGLLVVIDTCLASCSAEWWHIAERMADHCRVLVYDRAGYGQSTASTRERTPENIARELDELLAGLEVQERLLLVGHSQGGFYLTQYALMYPAKVRALILLDPATPYDGEFRQRLLPGEYKNSGVDKTLSFKLARAVTTIGQGFLFEPMLAKPRHSTIANSPPKPGSTCYPHYAKPEPIKPRWKNTGTPTRMPRHGRCRTASITRGWSISQWCC